MTKLIRIFYLVFIFTPFSLTAQKEILVTLDNQGQIMVLHEVQKGETYFGISRNYGINADQLIRANQTSSGTGLTPGDKLKIYFDPSRIAAKKTGNPHTLVYEVVPGTTLFAIRRASGLTVDELKKINKLNAPDLSPGQKLIVGYFNTDPQSPNPSENKNSLTKTVKPDQQKQNLDPGSDQTVRGSIAHEEINLKNQPGTAKIVEVNYQEQRGVAVWNQDWKSTTGFYVLHRDAPINSIIEIENPMFGRKAFGKVSGRIPASLYSSDVILIVSDALARHLGVIDPRFFVKVRYLQAD